MFRITLLIFFCAIISCSSDKPSLAQYFDEIEEFEKSTDAFFDIANGKHPEHMASVSWATQLKNLEQWQRLYTELEEFPVSELNRLDQISIATMKLKLGNIISGIKYKANLIPFNAEGGFYNYINYYLSSLPFESFEDYDAYLNWLPLYVNYLKECHQLMAIGIKEGVVAPKVVVKNNIEMLEKICAQPIEESNFYKPIQNASSAISAGELTRITTKSLDILKNEIKPAQDDLLEFFKTEYLDAAYDEVGISKIPNGEAFYQDRVDYYTTLDISADSIFNLGHQEVNRIKASMMTIIDDLNFQGDFADFLEFLRTDPQFYPTTGEELLQYAAWLSKKAEGQLPKYFNHLYELPFTVEPVPDHIAPHYTAGRYVHGSFEMEQAGIYWVNTYNLPARTLYTMPALSLHEAVPGHHLQTMIAAELADIPNFRKKYYISAFGGGWGLYSEYLGEEMGMYEDPYDLFGRYTYEMWRACRLVVDVGLHKKGWTRQQALDFLSENTALSKHECKTEIDRYIGWPGQAISYKIGEISIKNLRTKAEQELGALFDIKDFHQVILRNGSIPLSVLEEEVEQYILCRKSKTEC